MRKYIELSEEVIARLVCGKCVEGSLHRDEWTGKVTFRAYQRMPRTDTREGPPGEEAAVGLGEGVDRAYQGLRLVPQGHGYGARDGAVGGQHP